MAIAINHINKILESAGQIRYVATSHPANVTNWDDIPDSETKPEDNATNTKVFTQASAPTNPADNIHEGDIWYDSSEDNKLYIFDGVQWVDHSPIIETGTKTFTQSNQPIDDEKVGDIWFDTSNGYKMKMFNGTGWVDYTVENAILAFNAQNATNLNGVDGGTVVDNAASGSTFTKDSIYTGRLNAEQVNAVEINASSIKGGQIDVTSSGGSGGTIRLGGQLTGYDYLMRLNRNSGTTGGVLYLAGNQETTYALSAYSQNTASTAKFESGASGDDIVRIYGPFGSKRYLLIVHGKAYDAGIFSANSAGKAGHFQTSANTEGIYVVSTSNGSHAHSLRGTHTSSPFSSGLVGAANGYDFYAEGSGLVGGQGSNTNYGPFTGAHDALLTIDSIAEEGDIMIDVECINKKGISNTIFQVSRSTKVNQKAAIGVLVRKGEVLAKAYTPVALIDGIKETEIINDTPTNDSEEKQAEIKIDRIDCAKYEEIKDLYTVAAVNALGEGQINVCAENGDFEAGDLIVTSSIPGKGMKQDDDIVRSYTVAKVREAVTFNNKKEIKMVPCIYLCG